MFAQKFQFENRCSMRKRPRTIAAPHRWPAQRRPRQRASLFIFRNGKMELRALPNFALHPQPPAVYFHQMLGNRQTKPRASNLAGPRHVHAIKPLKNPRLIGLGNANAGIGNAVNTTFTAFARQRSSVIRPPAACTEWRCLKGSAALPPAAAGRLQYPEGFLGLPR